MSCIPRPDNITLAEECPVCCWCETPISPTQQTLDYPDGRVAHMKCPAPLKGGLVQSPVTGAIGYPRPLKGVLSAYSHEEEPDET